MPFSPHSPTATDRRVYEPVGRCIYCGATSDLRLEHIIPFSLGGLCELPEASCKKCEAITSAFEGTCARKLFGPTRIHLNMQTRRPKDRPTTLPVEFTFPGGEMRVMEVPIDDHPNTLMMPIFGAPDILRGETPEKDTSTKRFIIRLWGPVEKKDETLRRLASKYGAIDAKTMAVMEGDVLRRLVAKIAHAYAVATLGADSFEPFLPEIILGKSPVPLSRFVGGWDYPHEEKKVLHQVFIDYRAGRDRGLILARVQLFSSLAMPTNYVVVGRPFSDFSISLPQQVLEQDDVD